MDGKAGTRLSYDPIPEPDSYIRIPIKSHNSIDRNGLFGLNFGIGILSNNDGRINVEFLPSISVGFTENRWTSFLSLNVGMAFGI